YRPGFDPNQDELHHHPLALPEKIITWDDDGPAAYEKFLCSITLARSVARKDLEQTLPSLTKVRQIAAREKMKAARNSGISEKEILDMAMEENQRLQQELEKQRTEYDSLIEMAEEEKEQSEQVANDAKSMVFALRARIDYLE